MTWILLTSTVGIPNTSRGRFVEQSAALTPFAEAGIFDSIERGYQWCERAA